jgi:hypothetical protein
MAVEPGTSSTYHTGFSSWHALVGGHTGDESDGMLCPAGSKQDLLGLHANSTALPDGVVSSCITTTNSLSQNVHGETDSV